MAEPEASSVSYEDLAAIEDAFDDVDLEIMRKQYSLSTSLYQRRNDAISRIPNFWPLVFEQAPPELDSYIQPQDSRIFAEHLRNLEVSRPELDENAASGQPRSLHFKFTFAPNEDFAETVLEKTFWYRRARDGWVGLVSEPVPINWKAGKDLTEGLTSLAFALWEARKSVGDMTSKGSPEYTALKKKVEHWNGMNTSFFTWFGWVSNRRWVSAEEDKEATEKQLAEKERRKGGGKVEVPTEEDMEAEEQAEAEIDDEAVEVHQAGEEVAIALAEELWPNAIKYFTQAQEVEDISDAEFEEMDEDEDEDEGEDDEADDAPVDIRGLVTSRDKAARPRDSSGAQPAAKKQKK